MDLARSQDSQPPLPTATPTVLHAGTHTEASPQALTFMHFFALASLAFTLTNIQNVYAVFQAHYRRQRESKTAG